MSEIVKSNKKEVNKRNPPIFAYDVFGVKKADFYNVDFENDNQVFLNPYAIELLDHPVAKEATRVAINFFETIRSLILAGEKNKARNLFCNYISEPKETCLGYSQKGISGRGIKDLANYILDTIYEDDAVLCKAIRRIEDIKLFIPNVSDDRVSDIYTNVVRKVLINYTYEQCKKYNQHTELRKSQHYWDADTKSWKSTKEELFIGKNNLPRLLVPKCFVKGIVYNTSKFNRYIIIPDFIEKELLKNSSALIKTNKDGSRKISKKDMYAELKRRDIFLNKDYVREFAKTNLECVDIFRYRLEETRQKRRQK